MLDAVKALEPHLESDLRPAAINLSLGTHVGPHNGKSPLEEFIADKMIKQGDRFLVAAAGNDGGKGQSAKRVISANEREFLTIHTGARCKDLLVEFWWDASNGLDLAIEANIFEVLAAGGSAHRSAVNIDSSGAGTLTTIPAGLPRQMTMYSLFSGQCHGNLSCISFALSTSRQPPPLLQLVFGLESSADVIVNAWIVVSESDPQTAFVEGGPDGTVMVPASDPAVLSVAGAVATGQMWEGSSRGPAAQYQAVRVTQSSPLMAHLATLGGEFGTSYASPRACADAAAAMADPAKLSRCNDAVDVICQTYALTRALLPDWNTRIGFYKTI